MAKICLVDLFKCKKDKAHTTIYAKNKKLFGSGVPVAMWEPFSLEYIGAYLTEKGHEVLILQQRERTTKELLDICTKFNPDFVGFSTYTVNLKEILSFNKQLKELLPNVISILGGYHPSGDPSIINNKYIDFLVQGEGELVLAKIAKAKNLQEITKINGMVFKKNGKKVVNPRMKQLDFSTLPWPIRSEKILKESRGAPLAYPDPSTQKAAAMISYSRGCKHHCPFCASALIWQNVSYREPEDVIEEIKHLQDNFGVNLLYFTDLTFNSDKKRVFRLCKLLEKEKIDINWFAYVNAEVDKETLKIMRDSGCSRIGIGVESVLTSDLKTMKGYQTYKNTKKVIENANSLGILTRGYLCIGFPTHTKEKLANYNKLLTQLPLDQIRIGFMTPFVGTILYKKEKKNLKINPKLYTTDYPVIKNPNLSDRYLIKIRNKFIREYYNNPLYLKRIDAKIKQFPHLKSSFGYFFEYLRQYKVMKSK